MAYEKSREVFIKYTGAKGSVMPLPNGQFLLVIDGDDKSYICNRDDFVYRQDNLF